MFVEISPIGTNDAFMCPPGYQCDELGYSYYVCPLGYYPFDGGCK